MVRRSFGKQSVVTEFVDRSRVTVQRSTRPSRTEWNGTLIEDGNTDILCRRCGTKHLEDDGEVLYCPGCAYHQGFKVEQENQFSEAHEKYMKGKRLRKVLDKLSEKRKLKRIYGVHNV